MESLPAKKTKFSYIVPVVIFITFAVWWFFIRQFDIDITRNLRQLWGATYQILAFYGGISGLIISRKWGGWKSLIGRAVLSLSIGLFLQCFGQCFSSFYVYYFRAESPPYPAVGDIGFFGSVIAYIYAVILLARAGGIRNVLNKKVGNKIWAFLIPLAGLCISFLFFLKGYEFDWSNPIKVFLDFGYPFGQALYVSIAILSLFLSRNILGGIMRGPIWFLIFALLFQYFSDFFFLYEANRGLWYVGNINDFLYCTSYFIMTLAILRMGRTFIKIKEA